MQRPSRPPTYLHRHGAQERGSWVLSFYITTMPSTSSSPIACDVQNDALRSCYLSEAETPTAHLYAYLNIKVFSAYIHDAIPMAHRPHGKRRSQPPLIGKCLRADEGNSATFQGSRIFFFWTFAWKQSICQAYEHPISEQPTLLVGHAEPGPVMADRGFASRHQRRLPANCLTESSPLN